MVEPETERQRRFVTVEAADDALVRLAKIGGQVQGLARMIREDRYCVDVLDQIASVQKALDGVSRTVMRNYLEQCVTDAIKSDDPLIYDELMKVLFRHR
ncbi:metal-sensitive transcriptional regulator [Streptomyces mirabilis]|uniref:metal-sensitive transcriptional regulator n=1 Tax=Streptomyces mirabilis TaxID=68239 RepID=UPI0035DDCD5B